MHQPSIEPSQKKPLNAFFVMLTFISALPTLFFLVAYFQGQNVLVGIALLWSAAWTYVWWSLRHR